jgi:hypothetical protein
LFAQDASQYGVRLSFGFRILFLAEFLDCLTGE